MRESNQPVTRARALAASPLIQISIICLLGAALRLAFLTRVPVFLLHDSGSYHLPAWDLANGLGFDVSPRRTPGYPLFLAGVIGLAGQSLFAIAFVQHVLGIVAAVLSYVIASHFFHRAVAFIVGVVVALEGTLLISEHYVMPETVFSVSILLCLLIAIRAVQRDSLGLLVVAGALAGITTLIRPVGLVLLPALIVAALFNRAFWSRRALRCGAVILGVALLVIPWMARNWQVNGQASMSTTLPKSLLARTAKHDRGFTYYEASRADQYGDRRETQARQIIQSAINQRLSDGEIYDRLGERLKLTEPEVDQLLRSLTNKVIMEKPLYFIQGSIGFTWGLLEGDVERLRSDWKTQNARLSRDEWEDRVSHLLAKPSPTQERDFPISEALVDLVQPSRAGVLLPILAAIGFIAATVRTGRPGLLLAMATIALIALPATVDGPVPRYRYPADALLSTFAIGGLGAALSAIAAVFRRDWKTRPTLPAPVTRQPVA